MMKSFIIVSNMICINGSPVDMYICLMLQLLVDSSSTTHHSNISSINNNLDMMNFMPRKEHVQ